MLQEYVLRIVLYQVHVELRQQFQLGSRLGVQVPVDQGVGQLRRGRGRGAHVSGVVRGAKVGRTTLGLLIVSFNVVFVVDVASQK